MEGGRLGARLLVGALLLAGLLVALVGRARARPRVLLARGLGRLRGILVPPPPDDWDCDFVKDTVDNCPPLGYDDLRHRNPNQANSDLNLPGGDALGDWCDADDDADGVAGLDRRAGRLLPQPGQARQLPDRPQPGSDRRQPAQRGRRRVRVRHRRRRLVYDTEDNCRDRANPDQADMDGDRVGDACDNDLDGDFVRNGSDNCPLIANPQVAPDWIQPDGDNDGIGTACDPTSRPPTPSRPRRRADGDADVPGSPGGGGGGGGSRPSTQRPPGAARDGAAQEHAAPRRDRGRPGRARELLGGLRGQGRAGGGRASSRSKLKLRRTTVVAAGDGEGRGGGHDLRLRALRRAHARARCSSSKRTTLTLKVAVTDPSGNTRRVSRAPDARPLGAASGSAARASARSCPRRRWRRPRGGRSPCACA